MRFDKRVIAFAFCAALTGYVLSAWADRTVQQWVPTEASVMKPDTRFAAGDITVGKLEIQNFSPEIQFDPRDLKNSKISLVATFMPLSLPSNKPIDQDIRAAGAALFESSKIEKKDDNTFEVHGIFRMNARQQPVIFKMNVVPVARGKERPALAFSGQFNAPVGNMAPHFGVPAQIPVIFHVETIPFP